MLSWIEPAHEQAVHPFLYFSSQDVHRLREKAKTTHRDIFVRLRTAARRMKAKPSRFLPPTNWSVFARRWNEDHGNNFAALAMYCVLKNTDVQARNVAMQFFNAFVSLPNWRVSASIRDDVPVAHSLVAMATAYDFLFEHLKEDLRIKALAKISDVTKELYERSFKLAWGKQYIQNHVATNYVALFTGALVVEPHIKEAKVWKERANFMLRRTMFLLDQVVDGSMEEGVAYGSYTTRSLTQYIFLAKRHLGTDLTNNIWLREHFWFLYHTILPSFTETVGIADSNQNWFYGPESQLVFLDSHVMRNGYGNWLAKKIRMLRVENSTMEGAFAQRFCTLHTEFIFYNASIPEKEPPNTSTPQLHVFDDWGVVTYGGGSLGKGREKITFLSFKSSVLHGRTINGIVRHKQYDWISGWRNFNPGHEHPDQGSFVFVPYGVPFITEALYGPKYTWLNNALLFGPTTETTCSGPFEGQIGDCGKWLAFKNDAIWFADAEIVAASNTKEIVFISGEFSGWYRSELALSSVYRSIVLLNPGVLLVIDHIEKTWNSSTRYAGAFLHNRHSSFEVQEDQTGDQLASIMLNNKTHLVFWTNAHQGQSTVQSQSNEWGAEVGKRKTHFLNITTNLAERKTRIAYLFVAPGNLATKPKLQGNNIGAKAVVEINGISYTVSISTDFQKSCEFLGYDGIARVDVGNKSPIIFKRRKHLHSSVFGENSCRANVSKMSFIILFIWSIAIVILLLVFIKSARRRVFKCNKRICGPLFIFGMIFMWIFIT